MLKHPRQAVINAEKITKLSDKEKNIIESHMYPVGGKLPRHIESVVVDMIDDYVSVKEKLGGDFKSLKVAFNFLFILFILVIIYGIYVLICYIIRKKYFKINNTTLIIVCCLAILFMILRNIEIFWFLKPTAIR